MKYKSANYWCILIVCLSVLSCSQKTLLEPELELINLYKRAVLVYMIADNDLYKNALQDMEEMLVPNLPDSAQLIVYIDPPSWAPVSHPKLIQISQHQKVEIKDYPERNSASPESLSEVASDVMALFPASSYGLVLWSHGTGWLPAKYDTSTKNRLSSHPYPDLVKSFGRDKGEEMDINDLVKALPIKYDFIIFDACFMACVEVMYSLRNKAQYLIASPTEVLVAGFPYHLIAPLLFEEFPNYIQIAKEYMTYYRNQDNPLLQSATIAVIQTKYLDSLALCVGRVPDMIGVNKDVIQVYDFLKIPIFYDFKDFVLQLPQVSRNQLINVLQKAVVYNDYTPQFLGKDIKSSCGLSSYIVSEQNEFSQFYKQLEWYER